MNRLLGISVLSTFFLASGCGNGDITYPLLKQGRIRQLTYSGETSADPDWSGDGKIVIYIEGTTISSIPAGGGNPEVLYAAENENVTLRRPRWRPGTDSGSFAFIRTETGTNSIGLWDGEPQWIYSTEEQVIKSIDFTPDGNHLIFIPGRDVLGLGMQKMNLATGEIEQLSTEFKDEPLSVSDISCDPDGQYISYYGFLVRGDTGGLFRMPLTGGQSTFFSEPANYAGISEMDDIELSPNLSRYVLIGHVISEKAENNFSNIYSLETEHKELELLAQFPADMKPANPTWSPDGKSIAFDYRLNFDSPKNIYIIDL